MGETHEQTQSCTPAVPTAKSTGEEWPKTLAEPQPCSWPPLGTLAPMHRCDSLLQRILQPRHPHPTPLPHDRVTGVRCHLLGTAEAVGQGRALPAWLTLTTAPVPSMALLPEGAQQSRRLPAQATWSLPPPRCPTATSAGPCWCPVPQSPALPHAMALGSHSPSPPAAAPASRGPAARPPRRVGVAVAAGTRRDGRVRREEGRGRPTPPFRFPFFSFLTQRQHLCFLLQAAVPLPWGHQATSRGQSLPWAVGSARCWLSWLTIPTLPQNGFFHGADPHTEPRYFYLQFCVETGFGGKFTKASRATIKTFSQLYILANENINFHWLQMTSFISILSCSVK